MRDEIIVASTVAGISDPTNREDLDPYVFTIGSMHFWNNTIPHVTGSGITGAETANLWKLTAGNWDKVYDGSDSEVQLTSTNNHEAILSEGVYGFTKSSGTGITLSVQMP